MLQSYMEGYLRDNERIQREWDELCAASADAELSEMASDAFEPTNARKNRYADILPCTWNVDLWEWKHKTLQRTIVGYSWVVL